MQKLIFVLILTCLPVFLFSLTGWTDPVPVTNSGGSIQNFAFSAAADNGTGLFVYSGNGGGTNNGVSFKSSGENSLTWLQNSFLSTAGSDALSPSVSGAGGYIYNAWLEKKSGIYHVVFKRGLKENSLDLSGNGNCTAVNIFAGCSGMVHVLWVENGAVYYRKGFNNGSNWSDSKTIGGSSSEKPFIFESNNRLVALWQGGVTPAVKYSISSDGGLNWSGEINISSTGINGFSSSVDMEGILYAVWEQADKIYFRRFGSLAWEMEKTVSTNTLGTAKNPSVAADIDSFINVVWTDNRTGTEKIYLSISTDGGLTFSAEVILGTVAAAGKTILASFKKSLFLLYQEAGQIMYRIKDTSAPSPVTIKSPAYHPSGGGCNNNCPVFSFEAADNEGGSGLKGFSYVFDKNPGTLPVETVNYFSTSLSFSRIENGTWYLHVKAADMLDNWSTVSHFTMNISNTSLLPENECWPAPNPVRAGEKPVIRYFVPESSSVELEVFNEAGDRVTLLNRDAVSGVNEIKELDTTGWSNGVYFYRLKAKSVQSGTSAQLVKKILLLR